MYQVGLLLLTGSFRFVVDSITQYLKYANKNVVERLYVKLEPEFNKPSTKSERVHLKRLSDFIPLLYNKASVLCKNLDVRVVLSDTEKRKAECNQMRQLDVILTNSTEENSHIVNYLDQHLVLKCDNIVKLNEKDFIPLDGSNRTIMPLSEFPIFKTVCLGGTFDRLHNGHKVLLSEAALRATEKLIVGVTEGSMIKKKILWEFIEPVQKRITDVTEFLYDVDPSLHYEVVPITDPYGPTITDADIDCIVVSAETRKGGERVNAERKVRGMKELTTYVVELLENEDRIPGEEEKLSSSTRRIHLLGTCLKVPKEAFSSSFYTILLQGQPLTGKSLISDCFKKLGAVVICCNEIITSILNSDMDIRGNFHQEFDNDIYKDSSIDYKKLITLCLKDQRKRHWVAQILTENVNAEVKKKLQFHHNEGRRFIIILDSLLLDGNLEYSEINELWSTIMPVNEIAKRLNSCYDLSEEDAVNAVMSLPSNEDYFEKCNRIFCTQWTTDITEQQVSRAWSQLKVKILLKSL